MEAHDLTFVVAAISAAVSTALIVRRRRKRRQRTSPIRKRQPKYLRAGLLRPLSSTSTTPWKQLVSCGTSSDFIISLNFDRHSFFNILLPLFAQKKPLVNYGSPYRRGPKLRGRPPTVRTLDLLGIVLWYLKSSSRQYGLCPIFGLVPTSVNVWVDYGMEVMYRVCMKAESEVLKVKWPTPLQMKESSSLLEKNRPHGPLLRNIFAVVDGGRMPCADYIDGNTQNAYYEGYTTNVEVTNLFVFDFKGEVIHAGINYPGSWHDSKLASLSGLIYPKLSDEMTPQGFAVLGDSAFVVDNRVAGGKIVRARKTNETTGIPDSVEMAAIDLVLQRVMPSERQSAEWGIRAIKAPFGRCRAPLSADSTKRKRLLTVCVCLLNARKRLIGLNQIRTTYADAGSDTGPWVQRFVEEHNAIPLE